MIQTQNNDKLSIRVKYLTNTEIEEQTVSDIQTNKYKDRKTPEKRKSAITIAFYFTERTFEVETVFMKDIYFVKIFFAKL